MDVYTRKILDGLFQGSVRQVDLINLLRRVNQSHQLKGVILRNDNGSQFIAHSVRNRFGGPIFEKLRGQAGPGRRSVSPTWPHQKRTRILTGQPALAFHSILEHDVIERTEFDSYYEAKETLQRYFFHYNYCRLHRSLGFVTPQQKWEEAEVVYATTFSENLSS